MYYYNYDYIIIDMLSLKGTIEDIGKTFSINYEMELDGPKYIRLYTSKYEIIGIMKTRYDEDLFINLGDQCELKDNNKLQLVYVIRLIDGKGFNFDGKSIVFLTFSKILKLFSR